MAAPKVSIVADSELGAGARHGLAKVREALQARAIEMEMAPSLGAASGGVILTVGLAGGAGEGARALKSAEAPMPDGAEALTIHRAFLQGKPAIVVGGADDRGLMYALLEVADRIGWGADAEDPLSAACDTTEKPAVPERALSIYTMHRAAFEQRLFDEVYWERYFELLAASRFSTFVLIFGYENGGYMAPPYPYFFDVEEFPEVRVVNFGKQNQERYLGAFKWLIAQAHAHGLDFTMGIWDHIYRRGLPGSDEHAERMSDGLVWGLSAENLCPYTMAGLAKFLQLVPEIDALQFRMHGESGLKGEEMFSFWSGIYEVVNRVRPGIRFDARAKEFPDELIDLALKKGLNLRLCTKYWAEQMGLPFHPTHIPPQNQHDRRHGYADLLRYPQRYKMHWRLWNGGTTRVLLWADPEYVRRFAESTHLYEGQGFEVNEPLCTKMNGQPHDQAPFALLHEQYRHYDYEFQRYWHFFQVFGRVGYNPKVDPQVWRQEFTRRFGEKTGRLVERALHCASQVLPYAQAYCFPYNHFPMTRGWVEKQRRESLPNYAKAGPSDTAQFLSFEEAAELLLEGGESAKIWPQQASAWFGKVAEEVLGLIAEIEGLRGGGSGNKELLVTLTDLRVLAHLAQYHARRALAGLAYAYFVKGDDLAGLETALDYEGQAIEAWRELVEAAGEVYTYDLMMGLRYADLCGHWREELAELRKGRRELQEQRDQLLAEGKQRGSGAELLRDALKPRGDGAPPELAHEPIRSAPASTPLTVSATVRDHDGVKWVRLRYRSVTQFDDYRTLDMKPTGKADEYQATIPAEHLHPRWDFMYFFETMDKTGNGKIYPNLYAETPYVVVRLKRS